MNVGTKELKNRLSHYLRRVRAGEVIRVTDRDVVVAEMRAPTPTEEDERAWLRGLEAEGAVTIGRGEFEDFAPERARGRPLSRDILEDRR